MPGPFMRPGVAWRLYGSVCLPTVPCQFPSACAHFLPISYSYRRHNLSLSRLAIRSPILRHLTSRRLPPYSTHYCPTQKACVRQSHPRLLPTPPPCLSSPHPIPSFSQPVSSAKCPSDTALYSDTPHWASAHTGVWPRSPGPNSPMLPGPSPPQPKPAPFDPYRGRSFQPPKPSGTKDRKRRT